MLSGYEPFYEDADDLILEQLLLLSIPAEHDGLDPLPDILAVIARHSQDLPNDAVQHLLILICVLGPGPSHYPAQVLDIASHYSYFGDMDIYLWPQEIG